MTKKISQTVKKANQGLFERNLNFGNTNINRGSKAIELMKQFNPSQNGSPLKSVLSHDSKTISRTDQSEISALKLGAVMFLNNGDRTSPGKISGHNVNFAVPMNEIERGSKSPEVKKIRVFSPSYKGSNIKAYKEKSSQKSSKSNS